MRQGDEIARALWNIEPKSVGIIRDAIREAIPAAVETRDWKDPEQYNARKGVSRLQSIYRLLKVPATWNEAGYTRTELEIFEKAFVDAMTHVENRNNSEAAKHYVKTAMDRVTRKRRR